MASPDEVWMLQALAEADLAAAHGDVPVGCVVVDHQGRELGRGRNQRELAGDATAHAEMIALRAACAKRRHWRLDGACAYVTLEPCPMCAGALLNARVARVVYAAADPKAGAVDSLFQLGRDQRLNHRFEAVGGVLAEESVRRLQEFFARLRSAGEK
jgi:tRNA(adenine34) deaminase